MPVSKDQTSDKSSPNASRNLYERVKEEQHQYVDWLKILKANFLRLMQDNQRLLNTSSAEDRALRQQRHRFREQQMAKTQDAKAIDFPSEEMGDIRIDSPDEHHHYPQASAKNQLLPWILAASLAAGGVGYGLSQLGNKTPPGTTTNTKTGFLIELVPTEKKVP